MRAKYLIRFDDICPTMNWDIWKQVEAVLTRYQVKPILAVVPDNRDHKLQVSPARLDFWEWVREKQEAGWTIGLHGYQHLYETRDAGLLGLNRRSEFAGLPLEAQREKVSNAVKILHQHGVRPQVFVAPAHSFDLTTLVALRESGIGTISDGFFLKPQRWLDMVWIPQQMWKLRRMPFGVWTVCYHHNRMRPVDIERFARGIARLHTDIISVEEAVQMCGDSADGWNLIFAQLWRQALLLKLRITSPVRP